MTEPSTTPEPEDIRLSRTTRFVVHLTVGAEIHGVRFPSGRVICDDPIEGLQAAASVEYLIEGVDVSRVEWVPEVAGAEEIRRAVLSEAADRAEETNPDRGLNFSAGVDWVVGELRAAAAEADR